MKERIRQIIANELSEQARLKLMLRNLAVMGRLTDDETNRILDKISEIEDTITKLRKVLDE